MTDPNDRAAQLARVEQLRQRRSAGPGRLPPPDVATASASSPSPTRSESGRRQRRARRRHPALGGRIAAAGLGATTMLGLVTMLGFAGGSAAESPQPTVAPPAPAQPIKIVIHRSPAAAATPNTTTTATPAEPTAAAPTGPIELTANPVVRTITVQAPAAAQPSAPAPQPTATTNGSR